MKNSSEPKLEQISITTSQTEDGTTTSNLLDGDYATFLSVSPAPQGSLNPAAWIQLTFDDSYAVKLVVVVNRVAQGDDACDEGCEKRLEMTLVEVYQSGALVRACGVIVG